MRRPPLPPPAASPPSTSGDPSSVFPPYALITRTPAYDLRLYSPHWILSTPYTRRDEGFERLGAYGAGANAAGTRAQAAAQPVVMWFPSRAAASPSGSGAVEKRMTLHIVGAELGGAPPPAPTTPGVSLDVGGGEVLAVARFEGYATPDATLDALDALLASLAGDGVQLSAQAAGAGGAFRLAQYGPLFTMETRVNEVQVAVALG